MHKGYRNRPLTDWQKTYNKAISKTRWVVERTFGSLKRWFGSGITRLKGKRQSPFDTYLRRLLIILSDRQDWYANLLKIEKNQTKPTLEKPIIARKSN